MLGELLFVDRGGGRPHAEKERSGGEQLMHALVTGATGFIGRRLLARLERPVVLSRDAARAEKQLEALGVRAAPWQPQAGLPSAEAFAGVDVVFHLAGDPVAEGRW